MKKLLALLLAMTLIFSMFVLSSCKKDNDDEDDKNDEKTVEEVAGQTPEELYATVKQKLAEAESFSVDTNQVIVMSVEGQSMTVNQTVISKREGDNEYVKMYNDMTPTANMEVWYVDGMLYANRYDGKIKAPVDKEAFMQQYMSKDPSESTLLDIPESWFEGLKFVAQGDDWVLKITISGDKYDEYFANLGVGAEVIGDVQYDILFDKEGNLKTITTVFEYTVMGYNAKATSVATVSYDEFKITPPADADSYVNGTVN